MSLLAFPQNIETSTLTSAEDKIPSSKAIMNYCTNPYQYQLQNRSMDLVVPSGLSAGVQYQVVKINFARRDAGCQIMFSFRDAINSGRCETYFISFESTSSDLLRTIKIDNAVRTGYGTLSVHVPDELLSEIWFYHNLIGMKACNTKICVISAADDVVTVGDLSVMPIPP